MKREDPYREPSVEGGDAADRARRSAQLDRAEADTLDPGDPRRERLLASAAQWERQAENIEVARRLANPPSKPPFYRRGWFPLVMFLVGAMVGVSSAGGDGEPQTRTITQVSVQEIPTFKESCSDYTRLADITACRAAQGEREAAASPTTRRPAATRPPAPTYGDGTYEVGSEIQPGTYKTSGGECYWERLKGFSGEFEDIIANDNISGPSRMTIRSTDKGVMFSGGCEWQKT